MNKPSLFHLENDMNKKVLILNQVFWPDKHNTARHISELAEELVKRGWEVEALVTNRSYVDKNQKISPLNGVWNGVKYKRLKLPSLDQKKNIPRLITGILLVIKWIFKSPSFKNKYNIILIGTNPPFAYLALPFLRLFNRKTKLVMWGFDLYPEAIMVSGGRTWEILGKLIKPLTKISLKKLDTLVDIGPCMRKRYEAYQHKAHKETLTPWSFVEPVKLEKPHEKTRKELFGSANLALLYSGTIGFAHEFDNFLLLARELRRREASVAFCFAGFGNGFEKLKKEVTEQDTNISFGGFVQTDEELKNRLSSPDVMMISLKSEWTGISVPSKYFGALATGKPVLFSGSKHSALSIWSLNYNVGLHLSKENIHETADILLELSKNKDELIKMSSNAFYTYQNKFSKEVICDRWSQVLSDTLKNQ
ncbi:MAG: glycosyltransferase family 4 protein [bacterium]